MMCFQLILLLGVLATPALAQTLKPDPRQKNNDELKAGLKKWHESWEKSKNMKPLDLTDKQRRWWLETGVPVETEDDVKEFEQEQREAEQAGRVGRSLDNSFKDEFLGLVIRHREKRQETCQTIPRAKKRRTEWRLMSPSRRQKYIDAVNTMAATIPDPSQPDSALDIFVLWHTFANAPGAHQGASFLGWHREFLWRFANELRRHGYNGELPYWDSFLDQKLEDPSDSAMFQETALGIGTTSGNLGAPWSSDVTVPISNCGSSVIRNTVSAISAKNFLYNNQRYNNIMTKECFRDLTEGWNWQMEGYHNTGHVFWGGTMLSAPCSPADPVFWMHHCNVDCLWEDWRQSQQTDKRERALSYPLSQLGSAPQSDRAWNTIMRPFEDWGLFNVHGLSNHYGDYYFRCAPRPSQQTCTTMTDCVTSTTDPNPLLFCGPGNTCMARVIPGGACTIGLNPEQCWCPNLNQINTCLGGTCLCL